jgi:hypothetical protein
MKKIITTLFIVLGFYGLASAQVKEKGDTEFGLEGGLTDSYVQATYTNETSNLTAGFNVAAFGDYYFSYRWSLKIRAAYYQKGWGGGYVDITDNTGNTEERDNVNYKLNYINIPVLANWHFGRQRNWYLDFGPYISVLTSAKVEGYDIKNQLNSTDAGIAFDIGVKVPISNKAKFFVEYGGQGGVTQMHLYDGDIQNLSNSLNIGIIF